MNAELIYSEDQSQCAIVMRVNLYTDWNIYSSVTKSSPSRESELILELPENSLIELRDWEVPETEEYNNNCSDYIGEELHFVKYFKIVDKSKLSNSLICGLYYQACDPYKCIPPQTKKVNIVK